MSAPEGLSQAAIQSAQKAGGAAGHAGLTGDGLKAASLASVKMPNIAVCKPAALFSTRS